MPLLQQDVSLKEYNSFGVEVRAALYAKPKNAEELFSLSDKYNFKEDPFLVMGEGSNLLFKGNFEGIVLNPYMKGIELLEDDKKSVLVRVGAAENWDQWVEYAINHGWYGLENLSLIPGSVGSAPVQNIGAYGVEVKDHIVWLDAWDILENKYRRLSEKECKFEYRSSLFKTNTKGQFIITHVAFRMHKEPKLTLDYGQIKETFSNIGGSSPLDLRNTIINIRRQKLPDPEEFGNAGSFFKNPVVDRTLFNRIQHDFPEIPHYPSFNKQVKIPAAWLIEKVGWKGKRLGDVGTWPSQALVIVNYGGATGQEIVDFSEQIRTDVDKKFDIYLEREVNLV